MPQPSKFTADRKALVLESFRFGMSDETAAMNAGIGKATLSRWLERAEHAAEGGSWHDFYLEVCKAKAAARMSVARSAFKGAIDDPKLAWKIAERLEPNFRPTRHEMPQPGKMIVALTFHEGALIPPRPSSQVSVLPEGA